MGAYGGRQLIQVVYNEEVARVILGCIGRELTFGKTYNCAYLKTEHVFQRYRTTTSLGK